MMAPSGVSAVDPVAFLQPAASSAPRTTQRRNHSQHRVALQPHEHVPLALLADGRRARARELLALLGHALEPAQRAVLRVDRRREAHVRARVLVPAVHRRRVRERGDVGERGDHLLGRALEEAAAAGEEERVAGEDGAGVRGARGGGGCCVVADRVLRVAGRGEAPVWKGRRGEGVSGDVD
jgi:hypothetical protein